MAKKQNREPLRIVTNLLENLPVLAEEIALIGQALSEFLADTREDGIERDYLLDVGRKRK